jgi:hypothetical protein
VEAEAELGQCGCQPAQDGGDGQLVVGSAGCGVDPAQLGHADDLARATDQHVDQRHLRRRQGDPGRTSTEDPVRLEPRCVEPAAAAGSQGG